jgi:hypothetical protein
MPEERQGLMSAGAYEDDGDAVIEMDLLPPRWLDVQDEITEQLAQIAKQTRKLDQLHQKHVLPGFDDEDVKKREEREIELLTQDITKNFVRCQSAIKRIDTMVREAKQQGNINQGEETMAKNLKISLASRVSEVSAMFRKKQSAYLKSQCHVLFSQIAPLTCSQKSAISVASPRPSAPQHPCRIPTTTRPCRNQTPIALSRRPRSYKPNSSASDTIPTNLSLPSASTRSNRSHKESSSLQASSRSCRTWSLTRALCSIALTTTSSVSTET